MIRWMSFPQNKRIQPHLVNLISVFEEKQLEIDSETHLWEDNLKSDLVLSYLANGLERIGYVVEKAKKKEEKIRIPVLFGMNGQENLAFEVDAYCKEYQTVLEVEAGRAVVNYQFLKDFYEACMMQDVKYFCVAVKNKYRTSNDFEKVCNFFQALYVSNRISIPLEGILVIGY